MDKSSTSGYFCRNTKSYRGKYMSAILLFLIFLGIWVLLQAYILPKMGVST